MTPQTFLSARKSRQLAVLEGFHTIKHAIRFGAEISMLITPDKEVLLKMANEYAPDVVQIIDEKSKEVKDEFFTQATPYRIHSGAIAIAKRIEYDESEISDTKKPKVWLDNPKDHQNVGAVIRLAAGLDAGAVVVTGNIDEWNPGVLRGSAGLHYSVPVIKINKSPDEYAKPVYVFDDNGKPMGSLELISDSIIVFGSERSGVSERIKAKADEIVAIPMKKDVSSLNLATSVAIGLSKIMTNRSTSTK